MMGHRDGKRVVVCDGCHEVIATPSDGGGYRTKRGDGEWIVGHVHWGDECTRKFKANAAKVKRAEPETPDAA